MDSSLLAAIQKVWGLVVPGGALVAAIFSAAERLKLLDSA